MGTSFRRFHVGTATLLLPTLQQATSNPPLCRGSWTLTASLGQSLAGSLLLSPGSQGAQICVCVCCTQSPCLCGRPLLTCTSAGDTQTFKGRSGSVSVASPGVHRVLFDPSEHLWQVYGLILNASFPSYYLAETSSLPLNMGYLFLVGSNILLSMVVQQ